MTHRTVENNGTIYTLSPDLAVPLAARTWAVVSARLVDEVSGHAPGGAITISAAESGFRPRVAADGLVGLTGIPVNSFPKLTTKVYVVNVTIRAEGYVPFSQAVSIGPVAGFPNAFVPGDMGTIPLHSNPVVIRGRTVTLSGAVTTPLPGISVKITGVRNTFPPSDVVPPPPDPPHLISLQSTLYAARAAGTGSARRRDVVPVAGEDKLLLDWAASNSSVLALSDRVNIAIGDLLMIDALNPDLVEYITIKAISGASTADQPARITLTYPLAYEHASNVVVRKVTPQAPGPDNLFARNAISGDTCVFLSSMNNLDALSAVNTQNVVEIVGGAPDEYHTFSIFSVQSDPAGFFRLPPLSRVAEVSIEANRGGGTPPTLTNVYSPDYSTFENLIDFIFM